MRYLMVLLMTVALAGCMPDRVCNETMRGNEVCAVHVEGSRYAVDPSPERDRYSVLTVELQGLLAEHYQNGGTDAEAAEAIADLILKNGAP